MTRLEMAKLIFEHEARRDKNGNLKVYPLESDDGGGSYEVAGINEKYHPEMAAQLKSVVESGNQQKAEELAIEYIAGYTDKAEEWSFGNEWLEYYMRDRMFNRGPRGSAKIIQKAVGVTVDGDVGRITKANIQLQLDTPYAFLTRLGIATKEYELDTAGKRKKYWKGAWLDTCCLSSYG